MIVQVSQMYLPKERYIWGQGGADILDKPDSKIRTLSLNKN